MLELFILCERGVCGISFGILDNFHIEVSPKVSALIILTSEQRYTYRIAISIAKEIM